MPFTPFHMGAGVLAKAIAPRYISLQAFALSQIALDIEAAVGMARGSDVLHGWTHTYSGSLVVVAGAALTWKAIEGRRLYRWTLPVLDWKVLGATMVVGAWSHVALDALIHRDMVAVRSLMGLEQVFSHGFAESLTLVMATLGLGLLALRWGMRGLRAEFNAIRGNLAQAPAFFAKPDQVGNVMPER